MSERTDLAALISSVMDDLANLRLREQVTEAQFEEVVGQARATLAQMQDVMRAQEQEDRMVEAITELRRMAVSSERRLKRLESAGSLGAPQPEPTEVVQGIFAEGAWLAGQLAGPRPAYTDLQFLRDAPPASEIPAANGEVTVTIVEVVD